MRQRRPIFRSSVPKSSRSCAPIEYLEPRQLLAAQVYDGALNGKIVYMSGGHGWEWNSTLNRYATERGDNNLEIVEDFGNQDQMSFFADYVLRAGGTVVPMRPVGHQTREIVLDNDSPGVTFTGSWANSSSNVYYDEDYGASVDTVPYRSAVVNTGVETAVATYQPTFAAAGYYPIYTWALSGGNRTTQLYRVNHTGGSTEVRVDHSKVGRGWVYLGTYYFAAGSSASGNVQISNYSPVAGNVIADTIRFGNGMGDFADGPTISGYPREEENSLMWLRRAIGIGNSASSVIGSSNVSAPANMAEWMNSDSNTFGTSVYIGFHSNAAGGRGAVGLYTADAVYRTPHQFDLATYTGRQINTDMRALNGTFEHSWSTDPDNTYNGINFGEINADRYRNSAGIVEMDATIIEVAFHDQAQDAALMRDPKVRDQLARSTYEATLEYFDNWGGLNAPVSQPQAPQNVRAVADAAGNITLSWSAPASRSGGPGAATGYRVYTSRDGYGFSNPVDVVGTSITLPAASFDGNAYYFKIAARNTGGESPGSVVVGARKNGAAGGGGPNRILIVNGFDRFERSQNERQAFPFNNADGLTDRVRIRYNNTFDYVARFGEAIKAYTVGGAALGFDTVQNEQIASGAINLGNYQTVLWISGTESTNDETFSATEQTKINAFLTGGGRLFVSGAEIGWDLDGPTSPTAGDVSFYNNSLRANYVSDDANTYTASGGAGSIFAGLSLTFDNGANSNDDNIYNVAYADVLGASAGSTIAMNYTGSGTGGAAIQYSAGGTGPRVVNMGFPFETITTAANRNTVMNRILTFFEAAVSAIPGTPDLIAASDSGNSSTDNITNRDNRDSSNTLQISVGGTVNGATVSIYADGTLIGSAVASGTTTIVTSNGTLALLNGVRSITARQTEPGKTQSSASSALGITIDAIRPTADMADVAPDPRTSGVDSINLVFSEPVTGMTQSDLVLTRSPDGGTNLLTANQTLTTGDNQTFTLNNLGVLTSLSGTYTLAFNITPGVVAVDLAGNLLAGAATTNDTWVHSLPAWLSGAAVWNSSTKVLTLNGAATITADPGADAPLITASGSAAILTINPSSTLQVRIGSLTLSNSASATLASLGASRTAANHRVLVIDGGVSIDSISQLNLTDNDLVLKNASLAMTQSLITSGFNNGDWLGKGLTSSAAATDPNGLTALGFLSNAELGASSFSGVSGLDSDDLLIKYTYYGDADLSGDVTLDDFNQFLNGFQNPVPDTWLNGDFDYSGEVTLDDFNQFLFGYQTQGATL